MRQGIIKTRSKGFRAISILLLLAETSVPPTDGTMQVCCMLRRLLATFLALQWPKCLCWTKGLLIALK